MASNLSLLVFCMLTYGIGWAGWSLTGLTLRSLVRGVRHLAPGGRVRASAKREHTRHPGDSDGDLASFGGDW